MPNSVALKGSILKTQKLKKFWFKYEIESVKRDFLKHTSKGNLWLGTSL